MHDPSPPLALPDFDALFADSADPWHFRSRWYEQRKRDLTLACLPAARYASAYEPGCANGELTAALATRCDALLATDLAEGAVTLARARVSGMPHVRVGQARVPDGWPQGERFDLVVLSELCYYLAPEALESLAVRVRASLRAGGTVLACHWRWPFAGCAMDGDAVHALLGSALAMPQLCGVLEPDLRLDVWCLDGRSVAAREGLA